jgi:hypothetical protein
MHKTEKPKTSTHKFIVGLLVATLAFCAVSTAVPSVAGVSTGWSKTYGGTGNDASEDVILTADGGYAMAGWTSSSGAGGNDAWLVKTDSFGNVQWNKTYGGASTDYCYSVYQTVDGGYLMIGYTQSFGAGGRDGWLVKTDASGNMQWNKTYGTPGQELLFSLVMASDGGYLLKGTSPSGGWIIKTDANGNMQWNQTIVTPYGRWLYTAIQTSDGGYAFAASNTTQAGTQISDAILIKTDSSGDIQWTKAYGGAAVDVGWGLVQTKDGGYAMSGFTFSFGAGGQDGWLIKTDVNGNMQWNKTYGGTADDSLQVIVLTSDGGFAIAGKTLSFGGGNLDMWLVKTDSYGNVQWSKTFGGPGDDSGPDGNHVLQTADGGYVIAGTTTSFGAGGQDFYLVKTDAAGNAPAPPAATAFCSVTVLGGWTWSFFVHSNGGVGKHTYQWYEETTLLTGQTSMVLTVTKTVPGTYTFYCKVTDAEGTTANSNNVTLTVLG